MTDYILAKQLAEVKASPTMAITAKAAELKRKGQDIVSLSAGEPDFATPENIKKAGVAAINSGKTGYTAADGIVELKDAVIAKFERDNQLQYQRNQILISCGAKHSIFNAYQALLNEGDEVIIPAPYWVSYPPMASLAGAVPKIVITDQAQDFKISPQQLEEAINEKTKLFILCSPSNPTGVVYSPSELQALADVLLKYPNIMILSDDIYEHIYWAKESFSNIVMQCPELYDRTIVVNGVSKAYAMTGWRIGYAAGPEKIINAMKKIQSQSTSNPCSISQYASVEALNGPQEALQEMVSVYQKRQQFMLQALNAIDGMSCSDTQGAFYLFPKVKEIQDRLGLKDDVALADYLLDNAGVAVVPGSAFGLADHIRLSYAASDEELAKAIDKIKQAVS